MKPMKDPKESATPIDSHIIDPVGAIKITQNIEFETQLMKAHTKGGLGFMLRMPIPFTTVGSISM